MIFLGKIYASTISFLVTIELEILLYEVLSYFYIKDNKPLSTFD